MDINDDIIIFGEGKDVVVLKKAEWDKIKEIIARYPEAEAELKAANLEILPIEIGRTR
jgi:hypothetical protein